MLELVQLQENLSKRKANTKQASNHNEQCVRRENMNIVTPNKKTAPTINHNDRMQNKNKAMGKKQEGKKTKYHKIWKTI